MLPEICDGLDCEYYHMCNEDSEIEECPLVNHEWDRNVPLDKILNDGNH